jgi:hypothetical protein
MEKSDFMVLEVRDRLFEMEIFFIPQSDLP